MNDTVQENALDVGDWAIVTHAKGLLGIGCWDMEGKYVKVTEIKPEHECGPNGETIFTNVKGDFHPSLFFFPEELQKVPESEVPSEIKARALWGPRIGIYGIYKPTIPLVPSTHGCFFVDCENMATREVIFNDNGIVFICYGCESCHEKNNGVLCEGRHTKHIIPGYKTESGLVTFERESGKTEDVKSLFRSAGVY